MRPCSTPRVAPSKHLCFDYESSVQKTSPRKYFDFLYETIHYMTILMCILRQGRHECGLIMFQNLSLNGVEAPTKHMKHIHKMGGGNSPGLISHCPWFVCTDDTLRRSVWWQDCGYLHQPGSRQHKWTMYDRTCLCRGVQWRHISDPSSTGGWHGHTECAHFLDHICYVWCLCKGERRPCGGDDPVSGGI